MPKIRRRVGKYKMLGRMNGVSKKWGKMYVNLLRFLIPASAVGYITIDLMIMNNINPSQVYLFSGCSIFSFCIIYCSIKFLKFCLVQKCILMSIVFNEMYNKLLCPWQYKYIELAFVIILTILLVWLVLKSIKRIRQGDMHLCIT